MSKTTEYRTHSEGIASLGAKIPEQLVDDTQKALVKLRKAVGGDLTSFVANRLQFSPNELSRALAAEQIEGVALAIYNIEARSQSLIIGDQTGIGKGRQAAAMVRYGMLAGYFPIFFTDRYTLFSDMYRDCKALGIQNARPLIINKGVSVVDFDNVIEDEEIIDTNDEIWSPSDDETDDDKYDAESMRLYQKQYETVYRSLKPAELERLYILGELPNNRFEYMMITYSQLKDAKRDTTRLDFLTKLCEKHRVLFIFDEAHKSSSVSGKVISVITQGINLILEECPQTQCVFLSATFAKRPECMITFMQKTALSALATKETLRDAFAGGGVPMQEYVSTKLAHEGQMIRREHSGDGIPDPIYTYLDEQLPLHAELFDRVMYWFREVVKLSFIVKDFVEVARLEDCSVFRPFPTRAQLFYINKVLLLSLKAADVAVSAIREVQAGRSVVIGMSDTLECVLRDAIDPVTGECKSGDFSTLLLRLVEKTISNPKNNSETVFDVFLPEDAIGAQMKLEEVSEYYHKTKAGIENEIFHLPLSPIDVIRQLITQETFVDADGFETPIRFEECTGRAHQLEYLSPEGDDDFVNARVLPRRKRHSNHIFNDFQNNKLDVILINACGAIGASAHTVATQEVPLEKVRQRKMLIVQNDLDVNIDLQKRGRINRTGQVADLPPLYEYIITAIPSEKRLNMMLRAKLRSLSANTTANQDQDRAQADFIDISNVYGDQVAKEYMTEHSEQALVLGLKSNATASQLLARLAMLSVTAQQEAVDEIFTAYQVKEQELRRINQWDLEREHRDFEAEFVKEELFTAAIEDTPLGGCSMLTTYRCRHRTFPYDAASLSKAIEESKTEYEQMGIKRQIRKYYQTQIARVRNRISERRQMLWDTTSQYLSKYISDQDSIEELLKKAQTAEETWYYTIGKDVAKMPHSEIILRKISAYSKTYCELSGRENRDIGALNEQKSRLQSILMNAKIGQGYADISPYVPIEESSRNIIAVLKGIHFGKEEKNRFLPSQVQLTFALSSGRKEININIVHNSHNSNYGKLLQIFKSRKWEFDTTEWDRVIALYNNRIIKRHIITGNILGAFAHPSIKDLHPRFISFSLADGNVEHGLLLPMNGNNLEKVLSTVTLPLADGLRYANKSNTTYHISGIGVDFLLSTFRSFSADRLMFILSVDDNDSKLFEADTRFDSIRGYFIAQPVSSPMNNTRSKHQLIHYATEKTGFSNQVLQEILTKLAELHAVIQIPRDMMTLAEAKGYSKPHSQEEPEWAMIDWQSVQMPPVKEHVQIRIAPPQLTVDENKIVDQYSEIVKLARETLKYNGRPKLGATIPGEIRALYFRWMEMQKDNSISKFNFNLCQKVIMDLHHCLCTISSEPNIHFDCLSQLSRLAESETLSDFAATMECFNQKFLFMSPAKEVVQRFLDNMLCDPRLEKIRCSLDSYLNDETDLILDV